MARDGSGTFDLAEPAFVNGTTIDADVVNSDLSDIAAGLTQSLSKDGQTVPTASLPMGGFKHTNVAAATARTEYARADQVTGSVLDYAPDTGSATAFAIAPSPAITAYVVGQRFAFKANNANSGADPTLAVNGLTAGIIYYPDGTSLAAGDIPNNSQTVVQVATVTTGTPTFHIQSPPSGAVRKAGTQTITGAKTFSATLTMSGAAIREAAIVDVASASTCAIGAADTNWVRITGTNTVTAFDSAPAGTRIDCLFADTLTLTYNASTLILPTEADIVTAAGDTMVLRAGSVGGSWRCTDYTRRDGTALSVLAGAIVGRAYDQYTGTTALTANIPIDDTIPQVSEGTEILSAAITPKSTTNRIRVRAMVPLGLPSGSSGTGCVALFRNGGANAISAVFPRLVDGFGNYCAVIEFEHVPAATSAQTYSIRAGGASFDVYVNADLSGRLGGGVSRATLILEEISA